MLWSRGRDSAGGRAPALTHRDVQWLKGVSILAIVLHNYFHWVKPTTGENEFNYAPERLERLLTTLGEQPLESVHHLFSYLGHYGVVTFIVLSAYGLARRYGHQPIPYLGFMSRRLARLYPVYIVAIAIHAGLLVWSGMWSPWYLKAYLLHLSFLANLYPGMALSLNGPWWFFSFIVLFYAVFPVLMAGYRRWGDPFLVGLALLGWMSRMLVNPWIGQWELNVLLTPIGWLPEIALGLYLAREGRMPGGSPLMFVSIAVFLVGNLDARAWNFASTALAVVVLFSYLRWRPGKDESGPGTRFILYLGALSLPLFAVHGLLRAPFVEVAIAGSHWLSTVALGVAYLALSLATAHAIHVVLTRIGGLAVKANSRRAE